MKKFILFIVVMLPITAALSMGAGFIYAGNLRRAPAISVEMSQPARVFQPLATQAPAPLKDEIGSSLYVLQLQDAIVKCAEATAQFYIAGTLGGDAVMINIEQALLAFDACAAGIRKSTPSADMIDVHADALELADQIEQLTKTVRAGMRGEDGEWVSKASANVKEIRRLGDSIALKMDALTGK
jgi:hypothetical protein